MSQYDVIDAGTGWRAWEQHCPESGIRNKPPFFRDVGHITQAFGQPSATAFKDECLNVEGYSYRS